ncbi:MAG: hypothetical protein ACXWKC_13915 [Xanthobacteraceae bacterium]
MRVSLLTMVCLGPFFLNSAFAANVTSSVSKENKTVASLVGEIADGDAAALADIIKTSNSAGREVSGIRLNSLGGNLGEGANWPKWFATPRSQL